MSITSRDAEKLATDFREQGFVKIPHALRDEELQELRKETTAQIALGPDRHPKEDFITKDHPDGRQLFFRMEFLTDPSKMIYNNSSLLVIANPAIYSVGRAILGNAFVSTSSIMVFKNLEGGPAVELHRDDLPDKVRFSAEHIVPSADIYLDHTTASNGCLKVLPGSHRISDVRPIVAQGFNAPGLIDIEMEPGDVLFHDSRLVHGSEATATGSGMRRVMYYVFHKADWLATEGLVTGIVPPRGWVASCFRLTQEAILLRRERYEDEPGIIYDIPDNWRNEVATAPLILRQYPDFMDKEHAQWVRDQVNKPVTTDIHAAAQQI